MMGVFIRLDEDFKAEMERRRVEGRFTTMAEYVRAVLRRDIRGNIDA